MCETSVHLNACAPECVLEGPHMRPVLLHQKKYTKDRLY